MALANNAIDLRGCSEMRENGFVVIPFPLEIVRAMKSHIDDYVSSLIVGPQSTITERLTTLSDDEFVRDFRKPLRIFPDQISGKVVRFVEGLTGRLGGSRAGINYISEAEFQGNAKLHANSFDIFWRCVRPGKGDVGAPHCDFQFWEIARDTPAEPRTPFEYDERWKIWFPINGCIAGNSIEFIPGSHRQEIPVEYQQTRNGTKPSINREWLSRHEGEFVCPFGEFQDTCVLFHDKLVHRGPFNIHSDVRLSGEFTIILKR
jgi:hypothetical protein